MRCDESTADDDRGFSRRSVDLTTTVMMFLRVAARCLDDDDGHLLRGVSQYGVVKMYENKGKKEERGRGVGMVSCIVLLKVCVLLPPAFIVIYYVLFSCFFFFFSFRCSRASLTGACLINRERIPWPIGVRPANSDSSNKNVPGS